MLYNAAVSLRAPEPRVAAALAAIVVLSGAFVLLALLVARGEPGLDARVQDALHAWVPPPTRSSRVVEIFRDLTSLGSLTVLSIFVVVAVGHLMLVHRYRAAVAVVSACASGAAAAFLLKTLISRPRPVGDAWTQVYSSSFPSAHAMVSMVVFLCLGVLLLRLTRNPRVGAWYLGVALVLSGVIGVTRVYLGVHHASDVLAGWIAGLIWALCVWLVIRGLQRTGTLRGGPPGG